MDWCHLKKNSTWLRSPKYTKERVVLRGDVVKDDTGSCAVIIEQTSPASHMTAAIVQDVISRLPGCAGQASEAVSANTRVKMEDAKVIGITRIRVLPESECPTIWIRLPRSRRPKSWDGIQDPVVPLERHLSRHPLAGLLWERRFEKVLLETAGRSSKLGVFVHAPPNRACFSPSLWTT